MSDIKWIKLSVNMFDDEKIKLIKSLPNASDLLIEWIQILMTVGRERHLISGGTNSYLIEGEKDIPSQIFFDLKMIKEDYGIITVNNFENYAMFDRECAVNPNKMKDLRRVVIERDGFRCVYCGSETGPFEADHVMPKSRGGLDVLENLVCACRTCNRSKKDKTPAEWRGEEWPNES